MTAREFIKEWQNGFDLDVNQIDNLLVEFAKFHVAQALKEASKIADGWENSGELSPEILNAYPLENIK